MLAYDKKQKTSYLKCNKCDTVFIPEVNTIDIAELRALSLKCGWSYKKYLDKDGEKVKKNLCPNCSIQY